MSREFPQFKLRMPPELHERLAVAADASGRSLNAELVYRLERSFIQIEFDDIDRAVYLFESLENLRSMIRRVTDVRNRPTSTAIPGHDKMIRDLEEREAVRAAELRLLIDKLRGNSPESASKPAGDASG